MSQEKGRENMKVTMKRLREEGYTVFDISNTVEKGFPDLMTVKDGKVAFIEVKGPKHKVHKHQKNILKRLEEEGFPVSGVVVE